MLKPRNEEPQDSRWAENLQYADGSSQFGVCYLLNRLILSRKIWQ